MNPRKYAKVFDIGLQNTFVYRWNFLLRAVFGIVPLILTLTSLVASFVPAVRALRIPPSSALRAD